MEPITEQPVKIVLRKATLNDKEFLFDLRNDPNAFKYYKNPRPVEKEEHLNWLNKVFSGEVKKHLFILEFEGRKAGQLRIDDTGQGKAEMNIALKEGFQGKGLGILTLKQGIEIAKDLGFKELIAEVHQDNLASIKLFQKLGFVLKKTTAPWQTFILKT